MRTRFLLVGLATLLLWACDDDPQNKPPEDLLPPNDGFDFSDLVNDNGYGYGDTNPDAEVQPDAPDQPDIPDVPPPVCGDGAIEGMEACDDGNDDAGDGCSDVCEVEEGYTCTGEPSVCGACDDIAFAYTDAAATTVWVSGSFNDWAPSPAQGALELVNDGSGNWSATLTITEHGQHYYQFIVDGRTWIDDANRPGGIPDQWGGTKSAVDVCNATPVEACGVVTFRYTNAAPTSVNLAGSFNGWSATATPMVQIGSDLWVATASGLEPGKNLYKFVIDGTNWVPDPANTNQEADGYGGFNSILNVDCTPIACNGPPCCDEPPCCDTPPCCGNSVCPVGECGVADEFDWRDAVMYFAMIDRFHNSDGQVDIVSGASGMDSYGSSGQYEGGDLAGVTAKMDYLADLGVTALWISAPYENRDTAGAAINTTDDWHTYSAYHGYWPSPANVDYSGATPSPLPEVESRIGDAQDLRDLVAAAHGADSMNGDGIKVLFDYVMNHVDDTSPLFQAHRDWFIDCSGGNDLCANTGWGQYCCFTQYLPDFDYRKPAAIDWSVSDALWWAQEYDIDGYRLDAIKHVPDEWLTTFRGRFNTAFPNPAGGRFYLVGETYTWDEYNVLDHYLNPETMLDGQFDFPFKKKACESIFANGGNFNDLRGWMDWRDKKKADGGPYLDPYYMSTFLGNHDMPRVIHNVTGSVGCTEGSWRGNAWKDLREASGQSDWPYTQPADAWPYERLAVGFAFMMTSPGIPLIYYGDEIGLSGGGDPNNRKPMIWNDAQLNAHQIALRNKVAALGRIRAENKALARGIRTTLAITNDTWVYRMGGCNDPSMADIIVVLNKGDATTVQIPSGSYVDLVNEATVAGGTLNIGARSFLVLRLQ